MTAQDICSIKEIEYREGYLLWNRNILRTSFLWKGMTTGNIALIKKMKPWNIRSSVIIRPWTCFLSFLLQPWTRVPFHHIRMKCRDSSIKWEQNLNDKKVIPGTYSINEKQHPSKGIEYKNKASEWFLTKLFKEFPDMIKRNLLT